MLNSTDPSCMVVTDGWPPIDFACAATSNDPGIWEKIVKRYSRLIDYWGLKYGVPHSELDNLRQEVFTRLSRSMARFQPHHGERSFLAFLKTITRNQIVSEVRKKAPQIRCRVTAYETLASIPHKSASAVQAGVSEEKAALYKQVMALISKNYSTQHVFIFTEYVIQQRQPADIAKELGISTNVIYQVRSRILNYLRLRFGDATQS